MNWAMKVYVVAVRYGPENSNCIFEFPSKAHREDFLKVLRKKNISFATTEIYIDNL